MQAMMVASTLALLSLLMPPVSIVSSATVALVTLRRGAVEGLLVLICSSVAAGVLGVLLLGNYFFALGYSLVLWIPVWLISIVLREGRQLSRALVFAVSLGVLFIIGFYWYKSEPAAMWYNILITMAAPMLNAPEVPVEQVKQSISVFSHYMTGVIAAGSVSGLLLGLLLARWWQSVLYNPGGFRKEFLAVNMQPIYAAASVCIVIAALVLPGMLAEMSWNITVLLFVLYVFIGTAVMHVLLSTMRAKRFLLPLFYIVIFMIPHALLPVAFVGLSDAWLNLRKKFLNHHAV
jgi:hypothetical protein